MNDGGKENGWEGKLLMCVIRQLLKWSAALWAANWFCWCSGGKVGDAGELSGLDALDDNEGVPGCSDWRRCCWACGVELRVYIVRKGIS